MNHEFRWAVLKRKCQDEIGHLSDPHRAWLTQFHTFVGRRILLTKYIATVKSSSRKVVKDRKVLRLSSISFLSWNICKHDLNLILKTKQSYRKVLCNDVIVKGIGKIFSKMQRHVTLDRQCTYNVTLLLVFLTIVAIYKQYLLSLLFLAKT